ITHLHVIEVLRRPVESAQQTPDVVGNATDGFSLAITVPVDLTTQSEASSMGGGMGGGEMSGGMPGGNPPQGGMAPPSQ
ncbi:MAG: hypothetical protein L0H28_11560, partial [Corynebacterium casei]|nr:hypothetical protein [Corynebacterium casei]MDN6131841.1 hypothetical protein [Corynebacterium casei]